MNYTKGTWKIEKPKDGVIPIICETEFGEVFHIADVRCGKGATEHAYAKADARLIVNAAKMYELVRTCSGNAWADEIINQIEGVPNDK